MKLTIKDRVVLLMLLPKQAGLIEMMTIRSTREKMDFSSVEIEQNNVRDEIQGERQRVFWDKNPEKEIDLSESEIKILRDAIEKLDKEKVITIEMLDTILKIQGNETPKVSGRVPAGPERKRK